MELGRVEFELGEIEISCFKPEKLLNALGLNMNLCELLSLAVKELL